MCLALPGEILDVTDSELGPAFREGRVSFGGVLKKINLAYVPDAGPGEYVIVHAGFAIAILNRAEANRVFEEYERAQAGERAPIEHIL